LLDIDRFGGANHFISEVTALSDFVRDCPRAEGVAAIQLPGDPERTVHERRSAEGIPIPDGLSRTLTELAVKFNISDDPFRGDLSPARFSQFPLSAARTVFSMTTYYEVSPRRSSHAPPRRHSFRVEPRVDRQHRNARSGLRRAGGSVARKARAARAYL